MHLERRRHAAAIAAATRVVRAKVSCVTLPPRSTVPIGPQRPCIGRRPCWPLTLQVRRAKRNCLRPPPGTDTPILLCCVTVTVVCVRVLRYEMATSPEDSRYRDSLSPPCSTLVVDNVSPDVSAEAITAIFAKVGLASTRWGLCFPLTCFNPPFNFFSVAAGTKGERVIV